MGLKWSAIVWWRVAWALFIGSLVVPGWFAANFAYVATYNETDQAVPSDVIIVLGCPSYEGDVLRVLYTQFVSRILFLAAEAHSEVPDIACYV